MIELLLATLGLLSLPIVVMALFLREIFKQVEESK